jgi:hypothetical protein
MGEWSWVAVVLLILAVGLWFWHIRPPQPQPKSEAATYICDDCTDHDCSCQKKLGTPADETRPTGGKRHA